MTDDFARYAQAAAELPILKLERDVALAVVELLALLAVIVGAHAEALGEEVSAGAAPTADREVIVALAEEALADALLGQLDDRESMAVLRAEAARRLGSAEARSRAGDRISRAGIVLARLETRRSRPS